MNPDPDRLNLIAAGRCEEECDGDPISGLYLAALIGACLLVLGGLGLAVLEAMR